MFKIKINEPQRYLELLIKEEQKSSQVQIEIDKCDELELLSPNKILRKTKRIALALYLDFKEKIKLYSRAIVHNIGSTELQIRQTIEKYTRKLEQNDSYKEHILNLSKIILENPEKVAKDLLFIEKRSQDLDAQIIGINILMGRGYTIEQYQTHNLKNLILRCSSSFSSLLKENNSRINFHNMDNIEIKTDFRLFNCAMYPFFDNAQKYLKPDNDIDISVNYSNKEIIFSMVSRVIEKYEENNIFLEGFNGTHSGNQKGEGLGLYIFSQVLDLFDAKTYLNIDEYTRLGLGNVIYQKNHFIIQFSRDTLSIKD